MLSSLIDECIHDVFHDVLQAMVKSYFAQKIDLSRAATPPALAVAADILDDWTKELVADLLPEGTKSVNAVFIKPRSAHSRPVLEQHSRNWRPNTPHGNSMRSYGSP